MKQRLLIIATLLIFVVGITSAQAYYPYSYGNYYSGSYPYYTSYYNSGYTPMTSTGYSYKMPYYTTSYYSPVGYKVYPVYYVAPTYYKVPHYYKYPETMGIGYPPATTEINHEVTISTNPKPDIGVPTKTTYYHNNYLTPPDMTYVIY